VFHITSAAAPADSLPAIEGSLLVKRLVTNASSSNIAADSLELRSSGGGDGGVGSGPVRSDEADDDVRFGALCRKALSLKEPM